MNLDASEISYDNEEIARLNTQFAHEIRSREMEIGKLGLIFGSRDNALVYFAFILVILIIAVLGSIAYGDPSTRQDVEKALIALASLFVGLIAGKSMPSDSRR
jgi:Flp pilus assembly protein TadG